ncbi:MAG: DUF5063 domain-containing protein [Alloprevotella sp.]|nr:DUF5063 domain-containing protein [Alloprevotella sp.]
MPQNLSNGPREEGAGIYAPDVLDFIRVATEYCKQLEQCEGEQRGRFMDVMLRLLPMLYLKVSMLHDQSETAGYNEAKVTEEDYNYIRACVAGVMGERDDYLDVFVEDFRYSDQPVLQTVSENLADVYQALRDLVEIFREGHEESMQVALSETLERFQLYWGQTLLNALRALHDAKYGGVQSES